MQESLRLLFRNLPVRPLAWLLRAVIFPSGAPYTESSDRVDREAAQIVLKPGAARDRLTAGIFSSDDAAFRQGEIEQAFVQAAKVEPIERTLREGRRAGLLRRSGFLEQLDEAVVAGLISPADAMELERMAELRRRVIMVDSFARYGRQNALDAQHRQRPAIYAV
jgi:acyl-CoA dehydrogenase